LKGFRPVTLNDYVPPTVPAHVDVVHRGTSTGVIAHVQKRLCKPKRAESEAILIGFDVHSLSALGGPGYFVAHASADPGEVDLDYTRLPKEKPRDWPELVPSSARLGRFFYGGVIDVMRGLSSHVSVGRAKRNNAYIDRWIVLVREDRA
jgi:hypothetical protein